MKTLDLTIFELFHSILPYLVFVPINGMINYSVIDMKREGERLPYGSKETRGRRMSTACSLFSASAPFPDRVEILAGASSRESARGRCLSALMNCSNAASLCSFSFSPFFLSSISSSQSALLRCIGAFSFPAQYLVILALLLFFPLRLLVVFCVPLHLHCTYLSYTSGKRWRTTRVNTVRISAHHFSLALRPHFAISSLAMYPIILRRTKSMFPKFLFKHVCF